MGEEAFAFGCNTCGAPIMFPGFCDEHADEDNRLVTVSVGHLKRLAAAEARVKDLEAAIADAREVLISPRTEREDEADSILMAALMPIIESDDSHTSKGEQKP